MAEVNEATLQAALAGLLHDIGKFAQRAGQAGKHAEVGHRVLGRQLAELCPQAWRDDVFDAVANHHGGDTHKEIVKAVRVADWLASADRRKGYAEKGEPATTPLVPITTEVELDKGVGDASLHMPLTRLDLGRQSDGRFDRVVAQRTLFPAESASVGPSEYSRVWDEFVRDLGRFPKPVDSPARIVGLMSVMRRHMSHIPAATAWEDTEEDRTVPDVSLYDHCKVTAATAACLLRLLPDDLDALHRVKWPAILDDSRPVARMVRGDFSGIQSFIYRITSPESERTHRHTAKRLRGRSFYIGLMGEVIAEWLLRQLGLTSANALFIGGGRFDLLVPVDPRMGERIEAKAAEIEAWLVEQFHGVLGLEIVHEEISPSDFADLRRANAVLDDRMAEAKRHKFKDRLHGILDAEELKQVCQVCGLTPLPARPDATEHICDLCHCHRQIGATLPRADQLVHLYGPGRSRIVTDKSVVRVDFGELIDTTVLLVQDSQTRALLPQMARESVDALVLGLNDAPIGVADWPTSATPANTYLANAAPVVGGEVWEFDKIAECSGGTHLLGVLKADVDHLGLIFGLGLEPLTMSRVAALSHTLDRFFSGYLNVLCHDITSEWRQRKTETNEALRADIEELASLFYVVYAGGDDLLIVGPWDQTVQLAARLNEDFRDYTCRNPNITLSAGIVMVKPHYPVQRFVHWADEALNKSKDSGRNALTVFGQSVKWDSEGSVPGFDTLYALAVRMLGFIPKNFPRTLVHDLLRLAQKEARLADGTTKPCVTPELLYLLTRRLPKEVRDELKEAILHAWPHIRVPTSYVSLITRKEW